MSGVIEFEKLPVSLPVAWYYRAGYSCVFVAFAGVCLWFVWWASSYGWLDDPMTPVFGVACVLVLAAVAGVFMLLRIWIPGSYVVIVHPDYLGVPGFMGSRKIAWGRISAFGLSKTKLPVRVGVRLASGRQVRTLKWLFNHLAEKDGYDVLLPPLTGLHAGYVVNEIETIWREVVQPAE